MTQQFAVVFEAEADFRTATELADRVLVESIEWLEEETVGHHREWVAQASAGRPLTWKAIPDLAREAGIRAHGHFDGQPGRPDAAAARRAIRFLLQDIPNPSAIVLVRDQDDQPERRQGLEQARADDRSGVEIVVGLAIVERECWVISGFETQDEEEAARLAMLQDALGFDPCQRSHLLTACKDDRAPHSPKAALRCLSADERERERRCWTEAPLSMLRVRGAENGLADFLREVRERLARLIGHVEE